MFDQELLEKPADFSRIVESIKLSNEAPCRVIGSAYDDDPREPAVARIIAVGDKNYLVPIYIEFDDLKVVSVSFDLDNIKEILQLPEGKKKISGMSLGDAAPPDVVASIRTFLPLFYRQHPDIELKLTL